jgi:hypothetical protein
MSLLYSEDYSGLFEGGYSVFGGFGSLGVGWGTEWRAGHFGSVML